MTARISLGTVFFCSWGKKLFFGGEGFSVLQGIMCGIKALRKNMFFSASGYLINLVLLVH